MRKGPLVILRAFGLALGAAVLFVAGSILAFRLGRAADFREQDRRLEALSAADYAEPPLAGPTPEEAVAADLAGDPSGSVPFNRLSVVATHNSYHKQSDPLRLFFLGLAEPEWPARLRYGHEPLYDQLRAGVRGFELDVRLRAGRFETAHVPLVDDRSTCPDLGQAFAEIALWSSRHRDHLPVAVILELKEDWNVLDPALRPIDAPALEKLDALVRESFPAGVLFAPDELRGSSASLARAIVERGWPPLEGMLGRVLVVIHEDERYRALYTAGAPSLEGRAMFTCAEPGEPDAAFRILNEPADPRIPGHLALGMIVRTRADADLAADETRVRMAMVSGAQIVSTDYPPLSRAPDGQGPGIGPVLFPDGYTAKVLP